MSDETIASHKGDDLLASLVGHKFIQLTTFRKTGEPVATPVWFVAENGKVYVTTNGNAGKMRRIRGAGRVLLAPSDPRGNASRSVCARSPGTSIATFMLC